jgi:hypothetical protein
VADQSTRNSQHNGGSSTRTFDGRPYAGGPSVQESLPGSRFAGRGSPDGRRWDDSAPYATQAAFNPHQASTGELVNQAAGQISTLVRSELALGKTELLGKVRSLGLGGGMVAAAGLLSPFALGLLFALAVVLLDMVWPLWLAVLVPLLVVGALCLGLAGMGLRKLRRGGPPVPSEAVHSVRDDIMSVRHAIHEGRH